MNTKDFECSCRLATLFFSGTRTQAFSHSLETDAYIEKKEGISDEERLNQIGEITLVDKNYLEGYSYTLTMEDKKKVFYFADITDKGRVIVDVNELALIIAAFYWGRSPFIKYHDFDWLFLERVRIKDNVITTLPKTDGKKSESLLKVLPSVGF